MDFSARRLKPVDPRPSHLTSRMTGKVYDGDLRNERNPSQVEAHCLPRSSAPAGPNFLRHSPNCRRNCSLIDAVRSRSIVAQRYFTDRRPDIIWQGISSRQEFGPLCGRPQCRHAQQLPRSHIPDQVLRWRQFERCGQCRRSCPALHHQ